MPEIKKYLLSFTMSQKTENIFSPYLVLSKNDTGQMTSISMPN